MLLEKLRNAYIKNQAMVQTKKNQKNGTVKGKISSTKNRFEVGKKSKEE